MHNLIDGSARVGVDKAEIDKLKATGALVFDNRRSRPWYFDGRFLAARDLTRDQNYSLVRLNDLGRAGGAGVAYGLHVSQGEAATTISISGGMGVSTGGETIELPAMENIELSDVPTIQRLDAAFGLSTRPNIPVRGGSGTYILALRAVEYTANPMASYPTSVAGERSVEDGDIIEAVAITLIPYPCGLGRDALGLDRAQMAHNIFVSGSGGGIPSGALPLAMLSLDDSTVLWIDEHMVRREIVCEHSWQVSAKSASRVLRESHMWQYDRHLEDDAPKTGGFAATDLFMALPSAGRLPVSAIDTKTMTQVYFPSQIDVEMSIIPEDEVAAVLEESLLLPPIDLTLSNEILDSMSVMILVPVPRDQLRWLSTELISFRRDIRSPAPDVVAGRNPFQELRWRFLWAKPEPTPPAKPWADVINGVDTLWYTVLRCLPRRSEVVGDSIRVGHEGRPIEDVLKKRLSRLKLKPFFDRVVKKGSIIGNAEVVSLLNSNKLTKRPALLGGAMFSLDALKKHDVGSVLNVARVFSRRDLGDGLSRLEKVNPKLAEDDGVATNLGLSGVVLDIDYLGRIVGEDRLSEVASKLETLARKTEPGPQIKEFVVNTLKELSL